MATSSNALTERLATPAVCGGRVPHMAATAAPSTSRTIGAWIPLRRLGADTFSLTVQHYCHPQLLGSELMLDLHKLVNDLAAGLRAADALGPQAQSQRSGRVYQAGIGPHSEDVAIKLALNQMRARDDMAYRHVRPIPYPHSRRRCDLGIGMPTTWAIEVKMARAFGDNGKLDDTYLKDLLSPYERDHSALSDATKLLEFDCRRAILIYGFEYPTRPLEPAIKALELLMAAVVKISTRVEASFDGLVHPIHSNGRVMAWEVLSPVPPEDRSAQPP